MLYKLVIVVVTDVITPKTNKRRFLEIRGLFCYDTKYDIDDALKKSTVALKQYAEEKGYSSFFVENFQPVVGAMVEKDVKEFIPNFEFEVLDKKYDRKGGYPETVPFPENWPELSDSDIRKIVHNYVKPFYARHELGEWSGYSVVDRRFEEYE